MAAQTSSKLALRTEEIETRFGHSVKRKHMSRPRRRLNCGQGRDFFRLAASFASADQRESELGELAAKAPKDTLAELAHSKFLQARYQERSTPFVSDSWRTTREPIATALEKWHRATGNVTPALTALVTPRADDMGGASGRRRFTKNGVNFGAQEMAALALLAEQQITKAYLTMPTALSARTLSAQDFHRTLKAYMEDTRQKPFICIAGNQKILVHRARLFWSHRLRIKSLQETTTAEPSICYFHAALRSETRASFDIVYRLKFNEEKVVVSGEFMNLENTSAPPQELFLAEGLLFEPQRRASCLATLDTPDRILIEEITQHVMQ